MKFLDQLSFHWQLTKSLFYTTYSGHNVQDSVGEDLGQNCWFYSAFNQIKHVGERF